MIIIIIIKWIKKDKLISKVSNKVNRLVTKYTRGASWLMLPSLIAIISNPVMAQEETVYSAPDVNIFEYQSQEFELPGSGDYIPFEEFTKYNFNNINEILQRTPGVYTREEGGYGLFPNISLRGADTLRSAKTTLMEDGINIAPAPYSAPDAYYSPLAAKMSGIEILKGSSQFRFGPHTTGGAINYITTPIDFGQRAFGSVSYGSYNDVSTHAYGNYGITGSFGAFAILGEAYWRDNDGFRDFNGPVDSKSYGSDDAGLHQFAPMVKMFWQLPVSTPITLEIKAAMNSLDYNEGYVGQTEYDFNQNPHQRYVASQLDNMNSNGYTYYAKANIELNSKVSNITSVYYNYFTRDWFKLDKVAGASVQNVLSRAYATSSYQDVLKGLASGTVKYKSNNRKYDAYGVMNETNINTSHNIVDGLNVDSDLKLGVKVHFDKINRDQYTVSYTQAVGGALSGSTGSVFDATKEQISKGYALYFEERAKINKFTFTAGSRFEYVNTFYRSGRTSYDKEKVYAFVPGGGVVYDHNENISVFGGIYRGMSMPGPSSAYDSGTPLNPEKSTAKELGLRYADDEISSQTVLYHTNFDNVIVIDNSNAGDSTDNGGKVISKGIEFSNAYQPASLLPATWGDIGFYANYTFTNATLDGDAATTDTESLFAGGRDGNNVPYVPEHQWSFGTDYQYNKFNFGINMTYRSETYGTAEQTETEQSIGVANARAGRIDDAWLLNFSGGYEVNDNFDISAGIKNATDLEYISTRHPTGVRSGTPLTAWLKATASF